MLAYKFLECQTKENKNYNNKNKTRKIKDKGLLKDNLLHLSSLKNKNGK